MSTQGIGARVRRKEDARHLHGRGSFVSDMMLPGQSEVAFLRSPVAHGRISRIVKPESSGTSACSSAKTWPMLRLSSRATTVPGYRISRCLPSPTSKVRFVGEAVAMCVAADPRRGGGSLRADRARDRGAAGAGRCACRARGHHCARPRGMARQQLSHAQHGQRLRAEAKDAPVVVTREIALSRQAMVPLEGKAVLAYWDERSDQLMVYTSTQVPHIIRVGIAQFLGLDAGAGARGVARRGRRVWLQMRAAARGTMRRLARAANTAGLSATSRTGGSTSWPAQMRASIIIASPPMPTRAAGCKALDAEITIDGGAYSNWPFTVALEPGQATGNLPGPYDFRGYRCRTHCVATNKPGFLPYRGVARTGVCFAMELMIDAIARAVGREPWEVRHENLVPAAAMPYDQCRPQALRQRGLSGGAEARAREARPAGLAGTPGARRA